MKIVVVSKERPVIEVADIRHVGGEKWVVSFRNLAEPAVPVFEKQPKSLTEPQPQPQPQPKPQPNPQARPLVLAQPKPQPQSAARVAGVPVVTPESKTTDSKVRKNRDFQRRG